MGEKEMYCFIFILGILVLMEINHMLSIFWLSISNDFYLNIKISFDISASLEQKKKAIHVSLPNIHPEFSIKNHLEFQLNSDIFS